MKNLTKKSDIKASFIKKEECEYKGMKLSYNEKEKMYEIGKLFGHGVLFYATSISELKFRLN